MIACLDVHYAETSAWVAAVLFREWTDAKAELEKVVEVNEVEPYQPGEFYRRELPCLLAVLKKLPPVQTIVIDGYVWLDGVSSPGLGAHLHTALGGKSAVIGVAKTRFRGSANASEVLRGTSQRPLYVTAVGVEAGLAAEHVRAMHGDHRVPTLLRRADQLCRAAGGGRLLDE